MYQQKCDNCGTSVENQPICLTFQEVERLHEMDFSGDKVLHFCSLGCLKTWLGKPLTIV